MLYLHRRSRGITVLFGAPLKRDIGSATGSMDRDTGFRAFFVWVIGLFFARDMRASRRALVSARMLDVSAG